MVISIPSIVPVLVDFHSLAAAPEVLDLLFYLFTVLHSILSNLVDIVAGKDMQWRVALNRLVCHINFVLLDEEFKILE